MDKTRIISLASLRQACKILQQHARIMNLLGLTLELVISNRVLRHTVADRLDRKRNHVCLVFASNVLHDILSE